MTGFRKELTDLIRPHLKSGKLAPDLVQAIDALLDRAGVPRDSAAMNREPSGVHGDVTRKKPLHCGKSSGQVTASRPTFRYSSRSAKPKRPSARRTPTWTRSGDG